MFRSFKSWRRARILKRHPLSADVWQRALNRLPFLHGLTGDELARLRDWVVLFLHEKNIVPAAGFSVSEEMRVVIAIQACILILNLDLDYYAGWVSVIVYPGEFVPRHEITDEAGVVHLDEEPMSGESWPGGPVILSWADAAGSGGDDGVNVVIHEFAHKLDMQNSGDADGLPPLHQGMSIEQWATDFASAFADLTRRAQAGETLEIDPYALESPGEFFAVMSEVFFQSPQLLKRAYPAVYRQLRAFYRQDPAARMPR